jgi:hypothetical protein
MGSLHSNFSLEENMRERIQEERNQDGTVYFSFIYLLFFVVVEGEMSLCF